jgi:Tol biopolymer transport system component
VWVGSAHISPDGRWIAYHSNESQRFETYVRPFPDVEGGRWQISSDGGGYPLWARSGRELFFGRESDYRLMAAPIQSGSGFNFGTPQPLFDASPYVMDMSRMFDVSPDGQRFLFVKSVSSDSSVRPSIVIATNWFEEVKARVPTN